MNRYRIRSGRIVVAGAAGWLLLAACSGGGGSGVAELEGEAAPAGDGSADAAATEEQMLEYTECLRGQGLDVEDPVIDANGNVTLGGPGPSVGENQEFFEELEAARGVCGQPPGGVGATHGGADETELDDAFLEFARCMRDNGFNMPDPDSSGDDPFGAMHEIDRNDPAFQEAFIECRDVLSEIQPGGGG